PRLETEQFARIPELAEYDTLTTMTSGKSCVLFSRKSRPKVAMHKNSLKRVTKIKRSPETNLLSIKLHSRLTKK
ncbi:MAG: hypothetical protein JAY75_15000, partial [Candidatus Thiodiazotropha taylori]|nr:hypothetical protein [Candidatus Thiodiazotropha taylori]MCW4309524.1 hypothetical protein [Candidatus Thiodiazotropha endolucinida]